MDKKEKIDRYRKLNQSAVPGSMVCAGSSLMEMFPIEQLLKETGEETVLYNRGVGGFVTEELLAHIDVCILDLRPSRLFINIGTNDLSDPAVSMDMLIDRYDRILTIVEDTLPRTEIYLMAYYPVNEAAAAEEMKECLRIRSNDRICRANQRVEALARQHGERYIDINRNLKDKQGRLRAEFTIEGLHINEAGYRAILGDFMKYVREPAWK